MANPFDALLRLKPAKNAFKCRFDLFKLAGIQIHMSRYPNDKSRFERRRLKKSHDWKGFMLLLIGLRLAKNYLPLVATCWRATSEFRYLIGRVGRPIPVAGLLSRFLRFIG